MKFGRVVRSEIANSSTITHCFGTIATMANVVSCFVSPSKTPLASPVLQLHTQWKECNKQEREQFDYQPWRDALEDFLILMMQSEFCTDVHNPSRKTRCKCMSSLDLSHDDKENAIDYLVTYAKMGRDEQRDRKSVV